MKDRILQLLKNRDEAFINQFCQAGAFMDEHGKTVVGVCRPVGANEVLTFMHQHDALMVQELLEQESTSK